MGHGRLHLRLAQPEPLDGRRARALDRHRPGAGRPGRPPAGRATTPTMRRHLGAGFNRLVHPPARQTKLGRSGTVRSARRRAKGGLLISPTGGLIACGPRWGRSSAESGGQQRTAGDNERRGQQRFRSHSPGRRNPWTALSHGRGHRSVRLFSTRSRPALRAAACGGRPRAGNDMTGTGDWPTAPLALERQRSGTQVRHTYRPPY